MVPTIRELLAFVRVNRTRFAQRIAAVPGSESDPKTSGLADALLEMIKREDWTVNAALQGRNRPSNKRTSDFPTIEAMIGWMKEVEARTDAYIDMTPESDLRHPITASLDGATPTLPAEEWLIQLFTEQLYGLGRIMTLMRQKEIDPPTIQWSRFKGQMKVAKR